MALNLTINSSGLNGYVDPVAQSFLIERPLFVTKLGVYFSTKDAALPVTLTIRKNEGGFPTQNVIAGTTVVIDSANVTTSNIAANATNFVFESPVYLDSGEYSFVLSSDSNKYRVWISEFGTTDITNGSIVTKQPYSGTMYRSQNGYTWEANQLQDIKFDLYRAKYNTTSAVVDMVLDTSLFGNSKFFLKADSFKSYTACSFIKINAPYHGLKNGHQVVIGEFAGNITRMFDHANGNSWSAASKLIEINGIPFDDISSKTFTVSGVTTDSFFVQMSNGSGFANVVGGKFRDTTSITVNIPYSGYYAAFGKLVPPKTILSSSLATTTAESTPSLPSFEAIPATTKEFSTEKLLLSSTNREFYNSNAHSLIHRLQLSTEDEYLSPVIELPFASATFITNDINSPSYSDNNSLDLVTIASANTLISFSNTSILFGGASERANVKTLIPGTFITAANTLYNNYTYRVVSVETNGNSIIIAPAGNTTPSANSEPSGRLVTVTYGPMFVAEEAVSKSSSRAKYFTRSIELQNPSTAVVLRMAVSKPSDTEIEVYYKTRALGEISTFNSKEYKKMDITIRNTTENQFIDVEQVVDNITQFTAFVVKIVLKSTNISRIPKVKDLRIIALE